MLKSYRIEFTSKVKLWIPNSARAQIHSGDMAGDLWGPVRGGKPIGSKISHDAR